MDYKEITKQAYNEYHEKFDSYFQNSFDKYVEREAELFIKNLKGKKILDLGSGPGNQALYFKNKGFDILCIDNSEEMIKLCRQKGLKAEVMDIEYLNLSEKFGGIWANASLLHLKKESLPKIIARLKSLLNQEGIIYVAVKEGDKGGFEENDKYPGMKRYFTYFRIKDIEDLFKDFKKIHHSREKISEKSTFLRFIFQI